ncbi:hypothetical protein VNO77_23972 [Canavalia gladiata]|uniref:Uncharacterized protein n=1 Tax=Canavalia gladiata TaxID=3824 RepID=A0AAN9QFT1_CANGL
MIRFGLPEKHILNAIMLTGIIASMRNGFLRLKAWRGPIPGQEGVPSVMGDLEFWMRQGVYTTTGMEGNRISLMVGKVAGIPWAIILHKTTDDNFAIFSAIEKGSVDHNESKVEFKYVTIKALFELTWEKGAPAKMEMEVTDREERVNGHRFYKPSMVYTRKSHRGGPTQSHPPHGGKILARHNTNKYFQITPESKVHDQFP